MLPQLLDDNRLPQLNFNRIVAVDYPYCPSEYFSIFRMKLSVVMFAEIKHIQIKHIQINDGATQYC